MSKQAPSKNTQTLLEIVVGPKALVPTIFRVTDASQDVRFKGQLYTSEPHIEFRIGERDGGVEPKETEILANHADTTSSDFGDFLREISGGRAHAPCRLSIVELADDDPSYLFKGQVLSAARNVEGIANLVKLTCVETKRLFDKTSGIPAEPQCAATYGGFGCEKDISGDILSGLTLTQFGPNPGFRVTLTGTAGQNTQISTAPSNWWEAGYLEKGGLTINIREWLDGTRDMTLSQPPPDSWMGATDVTLYPGCRGDIYSCSLRNNLLNFQGIGFAIPDYHPSFEEGES